MLRQSRAFRIVVAALGVLCGVACLLIIFTSLDWVSLAKQSLEEPRNATSIEIAQAALEGQMEAMKKAGFDKECLFEIEVFGRICIERCVTKDTGFFLELRTDPPTCFVRNCICEDEESGRVPDEPS